MLSEFTVNLPVESKTLYVDFVNTHSHSLQIIPNYASLKSSLPNIVLVLKSSSEKNMVDEVINNCGILFQFIKNTLYSIYVIYLIKLKLSLQYEAIHV